MSASLSLEPRKSRKMPSDETSPQAMGRDQGYQGPAGFNRDLSEGGDGGQHGVQDGPQARTVGVLAVDQLDGLGRQGHG
jgi:hypothetical protein